MLSPHCPPPSPPRGSRYKGEDDDVVRLYDLTVLSEEATHQSQQPEESQQPESADAPAPGGRAPPRGAEPDSGGGPGRKGPRHRTGPRQSPPPNPFAHPVAMLLFKVGEELELRADWD